LRRQQARQPSLDATAGVARIAAMTAEAFMTTAEGLMPAGLAATPGPLNTTISPDERMPTTDVAGYLAVGESALKAIRLALLTARAPQPGEILDLPCGHGRVLRWLAAAFPEARLTACDLLRDGVDFCASAFGAAPIYSVPAPGLDLF